MNRSNTQTILITGARAPIALELARSFAQDGHRVIMADSLRFTIARWSNAVSTYYKIASPRYNLTQFVENIQAIIAKEGVTHFIPTCEEAIYVSVHKAKFACKVWTANGDLTLKLHNKFSFTQFKSEDFPIPETALVSDFTEWERSEVYVFKPSYSRFASSVIINTKVNRDFIDDSEKSKWIAQQKISGFEMCVYSIWDEGQMKTYAAYHPLYRAGKGAGIFFEPIHNEKVLECVKEFGASIGYTGQLCLDVIIDKDNVPHFIECNPRGTSGGHLINVHLAKSFLGSNIHINTAQQDFSIKYAMAFMHPGAFFSKRVRQSKDVIFRANDMKPFFFQVLSLFEIVYVKFSQRKTLLEATTGDIEWNGE